MQLAVIIPAAGSSSRYRASAESAGLGSPRSKVDEDLGGRPVLQRTVELFNQRPETHTIIVAGPRDDEAFAGFSLRHADKLAILGCTIVRGGAHHRWESVRAALAAVPDACTHVAIHDAARPCTPPELIDRVLDAASRFEAVIPAVEVADTLKRTELFDAGDAGRDPLAAILGAPGNSPQHRRITQTAERSGLWAAQTPQVFERALIQRAYENPDPDATDDAQQAERAGAQVVVVPGDPRNIKLTRSGDLTLARAILGLRGPDDRPAHKRF